MPVYKNSPGGFALVRKQMVRRVILLWLIIVIGVLTISFFTGPHNITNAIVTVFVGVVVLGLIMFNAVYKVIKQQKNKYNSFSLDIENDYLQLQSEGKGTTIAFKDIIEIAEDKYGNLLIKSASEPLMSISAQLESYAKVKEILNTKHGIVPLQTKDLFKKYPILLPLIVIACMVAVYVSNNKIIVGLSGISLIAIMIWGLYDVWTSPKYDAAMKKRSLWGIIVILSIGFTVYYKLFQQ